MHTLEVVRIVLRLQFLDLSGFLASFVDFLQGLLLFLLKHADSVAKLFNVVLDLKTDRTRLAVGKIVAFDVNHDVLCPPLVETLAHSLSFRPTFQGHVDIESGGFSLAGHLDLNFVILIIENDSAGNAQLSRLRTDPSPL